MVKNQITQFLNKNGPCFSSDITEYIVSKEGISETTARKRVSRALQENNIQKLSGFKFPKNETCLFIDGQQKHTDFWKRLLKAFTKKNTAYGRALNALRARGNAIPRAYFDTICGSPISNLKGHPKSSLILKNLLDIGFLKEESHTGKSFIGFSDVVPFGYFDLNSLNNKILIENALLEHLREWLKKIGLVSYNTVTTRCSEKHKNFGSFSWDLIGPSYLMPLANFKTQKPSPGFVVADIFIDIELTTEQVSYFTYKCSVLNQMKNTRPFIPILVASEGFTKEALLMGKKKGLVFVTLDNLFGSKISKILKELLNTLNDAAIVATKNPEKITKLLNALDQSNVNLNNIRGSLFNMLVGHLVSKGEGAEIHIGKVVMFLTKDLLPFYREIDVLGQVGNHLTKVYECKGHKSPIGKIAVEEWVTEKVPIIFKALMQDNQFRDRKIEFEFWTSSTFMPDAKSYLKQVSKKTSKYEIRWKEGVEIIEYSREKKLTSIKNDLKEHFT
jgi:hypothetical protein